MNAPAPLAHYAEAGQFAAYFERMAVRATVTYAHAPVLSRSVPVVVLVQRLVDSGRAAFLPQRRSARAPGLFEYRIEKREAPDLPVVLAGSIEEQLLAVIADCAAQGLECPTNEVLADLLGLPGPRAARTRFNRLEGLGHLRVIEPARFGARVVEVVASGKRTAVPGQSKKIGSHEDTKITKEI